MYYRIYVSEVAVNSATECDKRQLKHIQKRNKQTTIQISLMFFCVRHLLVSRSESHTFCFGIATTATATELESEQWSPRLGSHYIYIPTFFFSSPSVVSPFIIDYVFQVLCSAQKQACCFYLFLYYFACSLFFTFFL